MNRLSSILILLVVLGAEAGVNAQSKYETRNGKVSFSSKTTIEEFYSENNQVSSILKIDENKRTVGFNVVMRSFKFEKALMEEHFNEKYVHSEKYPSAKFLGEIDGSWNVNAPGLYKNVPVKGSLTFHGVTKQINLQTDIEVQGNKEISALSVFKINPEDYNIEIPKLVTNKISREITITVNTLYKPAK